MNSNTKSLFMKKLLLSLSIVMLGFVAFQSCVDKDYNFNALDKNAEVKIPPVPLGSIDTIFINKLVGIPTLPPDITFPTTEPEVVLSYVDTVKNIFSGDAVDNFFYDGASTVALKGKVDALFMPNANKAYVAIAFYVLNQDNTVNTDVKIPSEVFEYTKPTTQVIHTDKNFKDNPINIEIKAEYMKYMKNAKSLKLVIALKANAAAPTAKDFVFIKQLSLHAGSIAFEL